MGQCACCGRLKIHAQRSSQYRHKRFEFTPKRSWKFRDSTLRSEFQEMSLRNQDALDEDAGPLSGATPAVVNGNKGRRGSEEDDNPGEVRKSGRLVFNEDSEDDPSATPSQVSLEGSSVGVAIETEEEYRGRSWSNNSEIRGRFEILTLDEDEVLYSNDSDQPHEHSTSHTHNTEASRLINEEDDT